LGKWEEALDMVGRRGGGLTTTEGGIESGRGDGGMKVKFFPKVESECVPTNTNFIEQLTASAAHLRGLIHMHMKATELAKEAFMEALTRDVKCFESYEMLVGSEMMSSEEGEQTIRTFRTQVGKLNKWSFSFAEWDFIQSLPFHSQTEEDAEFIQMMYTVRLKKVSSTSTRDYSMIGKDTDSESWLE
jgi:anaphase-promoting complex subunit 6